MHSLFCENDVWTVVRCETKGSDGATTKLVPLFHKLTFESAMKLVNFLNGGGAQFSPELTKVLEMCKV
jgi:hypothetical protein